MDEADESAGVDVRTAALARYVALAACVYLLVYLGVQIPEGPPALVTTFLPALAAGGTLLAREPIGGGLAVAAGGLGVVQAVVGLAVKLWRPMEHPGLPSLLAAAGYLVAALVLGGAGWVLVRIKRRAPPDTPS